MASTYETRPAMASNSMVVTHGPSSTPNGDLPWPPPKRPVGRPPKNAPPWPYPSRSNTLTPSDQPRLGPGRPPGSGLGHYHRHRDSIMPGNPLARPIPSQSTSRPPIPRNVPMMSTAAPLPLYMPVSHTQACYATYASRVKAGTTSMALNISDNAAHEDSSRRGTRTTGPAVTTTLSGRRSRAVINYATLDGSSEGDDDKDEPESSRETSVQPDKADDKQVKKEPEDPYKNRDPLGGPPPGNKVFRKRAPRNRFMSRMLDEKVMASAAPDEEVLVPIRIEIDTDDVRIRDCFMWNARETFLSPELFAEIFCEELDIPVNVHSHIIATSIRNQLEEVGPSADIDISEDDVRVVLEIDLQVQNYQFRDLIEWDLSSTLTPEAFAQTVVTDLGLPGEFETMIAHALHEQLIRHKQDQAELGILTRSNGVSTPAFQDRDGYPTSLPLSPGSGTLTLPGDSSDGPRAPATRGRRAGDPVLQEALEASQAAWAAQQANLAAEARALQGAFRQWEDVEEYGPRLEKLSKEEMDRKEIERERSIRRLRRELTKAQPYRGAIWKGRGDSTPRRW